MGADRVAVPVLSRELTDGLGDGFRCRRVEDQAGYPSWTVSRNPPHLKARERPPGLRILPCDGNV